MCLHCEKCFPWNISFDSYKQTYEVDKNLYSQNEEKET